MRWLAKPKPYWSRTFAWYPIKFSERWIWWDWYYSRFMGYYYEIALPEDVEDNAR